MAIDKQEQCENGLISKQHESGCETEQALEPADFELDNCLRSLGLEEWFAAAVEGVPIWVY